MLKLIYGETGVYVERVTQSQEDWLRQQHQLAACVGAILWQEIAVGTLLLPLDSAHQLPADLDWIPCDEEWLEVELTGFWLAANSKVDTGTLVTQQEPSVEALLFRLWQEQEPIRQPPEPV
ncbi:hypothetical protein L1047_05275 [Synechococcus sp. Nb3U1]|uniref:alr0857 family protein n=1 Tax=Synechococcus sp. Nb3U1 TaxID=1914529 RepID=UPI001F18FF05|nr:alr0857 family protein [Synechococcus sp. Nb3U1]MCF2970605.1 hypothetical protein [Synechococcus sp. Nb3U1]